MQCNIDAKGKAIRWAMGAIFLACGTTLGVLAATNVLTGAWVWGVAATLLVVGGFGVFEARAGWCVIRAMGLRTPW